MIFTGPVSGIEKAKIRRQKAKERNKKSEEYFAKKRKQAQEEFLDSPMKNRLFNQFLKLQNEHFINIATQLVTLSRRIKAIQDHLDIDDIELTEDEKRVDMISHITLMEFKDDETV